MRKAGTIGLIFSLALAFAIGAVVGTFGYGKMIKDREELRATALYCSASSKMDAGEYGDALQSLYSLLSIRPDDRAARFIIAYIYFIRGADDFALEEFENSLSMRHSNDFFDKPDIQTDILQLDLLQARCYLSELYTKRNERTKAAEIVAEAYKEYPYALEALSAFIEGAEEKDDQNSVALQKRKAVYINCADRIQKFMEVNLKAIR